MSVCSGAWIAQLQRTLDRGCVHCRVYCCLQSAVKKAGLGFGIGPAGRPVQRPQLVHVIDGGRQDEDEDEVGAASVKEE